MVSPSSLQASETILKVDCEGDLRRALLSGTPNYAGIDRAIQEIWPQRSAREAKYLDEEGDACTLTEQTFPDFLCTAKKTTTSQVLRLSLPQAVVPLSVPPVDLATAPTASESFSQPWQHVELGDDAGEEGLHTVADLTDMQCAEEGSPAVESPCLMADAQEVAAEPEFQEVEEVMADSQEVAAESEVEEVEEEPSPPSPPPEPEFEERDEASVVEETAAGSTADEGCSSHDNAQQDHAALEMVDIIIAAFDETGDAHLNFAESSALQKAACPVQPLQQNWEVYSYQQRCADWGEDPEVGLGREALTCIYESRPQALHMDFEAAKRKLQGVAPEEVLQDDTSRHTLSPANLILPMVASRILGQAQQLRFCLGSRMRTLL